jgi:hypothetical protein
MYRRAALRSNINGREELLARFGIYKLTILNEAVFDLLTICATDRLGRSARNLIPDCVLSDPEDLVVQVGKSLKFGPTISGFTTR